MATNIADLKNKATPPAADREQPTLLQLMQSDRVKKGMGAVASKHLDPERFLRLATNALVRTPALLQCNPRSVLGAFMTAAALGLEPNTVEQQAFLIPYKRKQYGGVDERGNKIFKETFDCNFQIGYRGFITLAYRLPDLQNLQAEAIHMNDKFDHSLGSEQFLKYSKTLHDRGDLVGAFCYTRFARAEAASVLTREDIEKVRERSETYKSLRAAVGYAKTDKERAYAESKLEETPWVLWYDEMAAKTAIKRHCKRLPKPAESSLHTAAAIDDAADGAIDLSAMADPDAVNAVMHDGAPAPALEDNPGEQVPTTVHREAEHVETIRDVEQKPKEEAAQGDQPTLKDAIKAINDGRLDEAADIARGLNEEGQALVNAQLDALKRKKAAATAKAKVGDIE